MTIQCYGTYGFFSTHAPFLCVDFGPDDHWDPNVDTCTVMDDDLKLNSDPALVQHIAEKLGLASLLKSPIDKVTFDIEARLERSKNRLWDRAWVSFGLLALVILLRVARRS